ncbi:DUF2336 domain-containing protein [Sphingomonas echinoides]|jgi:hypothetical protein|uniref:DUF2336 domain-containing protein n=1 Tax=Sphingomonas echinoides TaxID=59803 RepID=UPI003EE8AD66
MSNECGDKDAGANGAVTALPNRAAAADARADDRLRIAIADFFLAEAARLDDRTRIAMAATLGDLVQSVEAALRHHAARLLLARDAALLSAAVEAEGASIFDRLAQAGVLRDAELMRELLGRVQQDLLTDALPGESPDDPDRPSLLPRLASATDRVISASAVALMTAESRRRGSPAPGQPAVTDLPAELHHRVIWWVAAAIREGLEAQDGESRMLLDRALVDAALRSIAAHDEGDRLEATALRLASALDPQASELAILLVEALADRRLALFIALLARALGLDYADAREIVLDRDGSRLWLVLRALELDRAAIARIGLALCEAEPVRNLDRFADGINDILAISPSTARHALAPLLLHRDYRAALVALGRGTHQ